MRLLFNVLLISTSMICMTIAECGSQSPTLPAPSPVQQPAAVSVHEAQEVSYCDLVSSPQLYNGKLISTEATAVATSELAFLYDVRCDSPDPWTDFEFENDHAAEKLLPLLDRSLGKHTNRRANVAIVGRFEGPGKDGYGHLNSFRFHFLIMAVEKTEPTPSDTPWPWETKNWKIAN